ncbi:MAG: ABC transporter ATP-binding protein [Spirochaetales bacterium]|nr:ABC transporter ATP-binding protein [Spirochaetales bacterium]
MALCVSVDHVSKQYILGNFGYGTFRHDLQSWWAKLRGKEDPNAKLGGPGLGEANEEFMALNDVSFEVHEGDRVGIVGRNGSGKSTILKILSRLTTPTRGSVKIKGRVASLLEVGTGFHPDLTGRENVYLNGSILGMRRWEIREKFEEIVAFSEINQFIDTPVKRYSSGMYIRLAFAVAAHLKSEILILDEILAVGDMGFQQKCVAKMKSLGQDEGRTIIFVSHIPGYVKELCTRAILLRKGQMVMEGETLPVMDEYERELRG